MTGAGRNSNQGPFSPDIHICSPPLTDLDHPISVSVGSEESAAIPKSIMKRFLSGIQYPVAWKQKAGRSRYHLPGDGDDTFPHVLNYLQSAVALEVNVMERKHNINKNTLMKAHNYATLIKPEKGGTLAPHDSSLIGQRTCPSFESKLAVR